MLSFDACAMKRTRPESRAERVSTVSAISQMWPDRSGSSDLAVLFASVEASPGSLAVVESGVVYVNPAWARTFELVDTSQGQGGAVEDFIPGPIPMEGNGSAKILPMAELEKQTILGTIAQPERR
jgi:hypothetical protein